MRNTFDTVPMGVMEIDGNGDCVRFVRSNQSFRDFLMRTFSFDLSDPSAEHAIPKDGVGSAFIRALERSRDDGGRTFMDETLKDGSIAHSFLRSIAKNPVNGRESIAVAVLSIAMPDQSATYAQIARALAADYYNIYIIDLDTNEYIEYSSGIGDDEMSLERHGEDFFSSARRDALTRIYSEDRDSFLALFTKENVLGDLETQGVFATTYRLVDTGTPTYVNMKVTRLQGTNRLILGVSNVDARMKQLEEEERLRRERTSLGRIAALSPDYIVLYTVDPQTGHYTQYSPSTEFMGFGLAKQGDDFFGDVVRDAPKAIAPEDMERHLRVLTKDNMLAEIRKNGSFVHNYRLLLGGSSLPVSLKATMVQEESGETIILGVTNDEKDDAYRRKLAETQAIASLLDNMPGMTFTKDAHTGVYLACNQAFAEYAHKSTPDDVVGLTDAQIFDAQTASHFVEDDKVALSMKRPYLFFEDVRDASGNQRQFQTTKLKYTDPSGRLCLQGMCQDVTDMIRIQRENVSTREAYERARNTGIIYNHLAHALARGYTELFYVNVDTDEFIEFHTDDERGVLSEERRGSDFFEGCERDAKLYVHPDDQQKFVQAMNRQFLKDALSNSKVFVFSYRRLRSGQPLYVQMQVSRMEDDRRFVVLAVQDIDELMRQRRAEERIREERIVYARLHALAGNYICVYVVDPQTGSYRVCSATPEYQKVFDQPSEGTNFFAGLRTAIQAFIHPDDQQRVLPLLTQHNVLTEVACSGYYTLNYRIVASGKPRYVQVRAAMVEEEEGPRLIVGLYDIDAQVRRKEEYGRRLEQARIQANTDALTGVKNKHAYVTESERIDRQIAQRQQPPFAIVVFDVNDLKKVNDTAGHQAGDQCLRNSCAVICDIFKHSPVFRIGGDEFAVIARNRDYEHLEALIEEMGRRNAEALRRGGNVIACGMSRYEDDANVAAVFARADKSMYENKSALKSGDLPESALGAPSPS
jgi:diguanylate cyclase (GGDEF)-like protein